MRIQSNFVDYYDYLAHQFGPDPKIFYLRKHPVATFFTPESGENPTVPRNWGGRDERNYIGLAICGKFYLLEWTWKQNHAPFDPRYVKFEVVKSQKSNSLHYEMGKHFVGLDQVSKYIGQPVFLFKTEKIRTKGNSWKTQYQFFDFMIPLNEIGFHRYYQATKIYQDLQYYIANVLNDGIDIRPPTEIADIDKVVQYGFDKKQSFRHRKT